MIVETQDGRQYTLPLTRGEVKIIRFSEDNTNHSAFDSAFNSVWQGRWNTSEGTMNLSQSGNMVQGSYSQDNGRIRGQVTGNTLNGYWIENGSAQRCSRAMDGSFHWGRISYKMNANRSEFEGLWSYCDGEPNSGWNGSKS
ncbi:hypothetical protein IQ215_11470 [Cyanobacterium stanieri LEGE 03274]|uniref:Uncharacterized protein n=1 Tax=Cyanobacterium stanieri LEGE 03274 TaxID=1828756 RepID=A0ABR9V5Z1_9CHRO|nr:hypothetical protein [Cyanobacterium stanieri]MBE9223317.1 hypothetical protein [Cyanobacterium stanieri LEGE 03274]